MNILKKIGAALLASVLMAATAVTAGASTESDSEIFDVKIETLNDGKGITISEIPPQYAKCDTILATVYFLKMVKIDGEVKNEGTNRYALLIRQEKSNYPIGLWQLCDTETGQYLGYGEGLSGICVYNNNDNVLAIGVNDTNKYYEELFSDYNAVLVYFSGIKDGEKVVYLENGEESQEDYGVIKILDEIPEISTDTSDETFSEASGSDEKNPNTGAPGVSVVLGAAALASAAVIAARRKKR